MSINYVSCPFCSTDNGEKCFDKIGLKHHLSRGYCREFNQTLTVEEEEKSFAVNRFKLRIQKLTDTLIALKNKRLHDTPI